MDIIFIYPIWSIIKKYFKTLFLYEGCNRCIKENKFCMKLLCFGCNKKVCMNECSVPICDWCLYYGGYNWFRCKNDEICKNVIKGKYVIRL